MIDRIYVIQPVVGGVSLSGIQEVKATIGGRGSSDISFIITYPEAMMALDMVIQANASYQAKI